MEAWSPNLVNLAADMTLTGFSKKNFTGAHQQVFKETLAAKLQVAASAVGTTGITDADTDAERRLGLHPLGQKRSLLAPQHGQRALAATGSVMVAYEVRGLSSVQAEKTKTHISDLSSQSSERGTFGSELKERFTSASLPVPPAFGVTGASTAALVVDDDDLTGGSTSTKTNFDGNNLGNEWYSDTDGEIMFVVIAVGILMVVWIVYLMCKPKPKRPKNRIKEEEEKETGAEHKQMDKAPVPMHQLHAGLQVPRIQQVPGMQGLGQGLRMQGLGRLPPRGMAPVGYMLPRGPATIGAWANGIGVPSAPIPYGSGGALGLRQPGMASPHNVGSRVTSPQRIISPQQMLSSQQILSSPQRMVPRGAMPMPKGPVEMRMQQQMQAQAQTQQLPSLHQQQLPSLRNQLMQQQFFAMQQQRQQQQGTHQQSPPGGQAVVYMNGLPGADEEGVVDL
jgi:hypothetical protein